MDTRSVDHGSYGYIRVLIVGVGVTEIVSFFRVQVMWLCLPAQGCQQNMHCKKCYSIPSTPLLDTWTAGGEDIFSTLSMPGT